MPFDVFALFWPDLALAEFSAVAAVPGVLVLFVAVVVVFEHVEPVTAN